MFAGARCIGLFAEDIETIADWRMPTPLPGAPGAVLGIVCLRSRMSTVLDARTLLGEAGTCAGGRLVTLRGDEQIALAVDRTAELIEGPPNLTRDPKEPSSLILGVLENSDSPVSLIDVTQLFTTAMRGRERRKRSF